MSSKSPGSREVQSSSRPKGVPSAPAEPTEPLGHLRRTLSSAGIYALASVAQSSLSFFLLPVYLDH
jgi:hypothetical protein